MPLRKNFEMYYPNRFIISLKIRAIETRIKERQAKDLIDDANNVER